MAFISFISSKRCWIIILFVETRVLFCTAKGNETEDEVGSVLLISVSVLDTYLLTYFSRFGGCDPDTDLQVGEWYNSEASFVSLCVKFIYQDLPSRIDRVDAPTMKYQDRGCGMKF
ncbi:unnamed protein product [Amoebophrya sp. A120]|nr:unnamed protein product [Amoebophrya sp. A120]|eukprot:GSA120T00017113001.1